MLSASRLATSAAWLLAACLCLPACRTAPPPTVSVPIVQPGAPGQPNQTIDAARAVDVSRVRFTTADVAFMQGMIGHHAQALEMTELLKSHTHDASMQTLAERIDISQADEIRLMQEWLVRRGQWAPEQYAHHHETMMMPGMLTPEQMAQLAAAQGPEFDRMFLEAMIAHHQGALTMVDELMKTPGGAQESEIFAFVSDVEADQRAEIARMTSMLQERAK